MKTVPPSPEYLELVERLRERQRPATPPPAPQPSKPLLRSPSRLARVFHRRPAHWFV